MQATPMRDAATDKCRRATSCQHSTASEIIGKVGKIGNSGKVYHDHSDRLRCDQENSHERPRAVGRKGRKRPIINFWPLVLVALFPITCQSLLHPSTNGG